MVKVLRFQASCSHQGNATKHDANDAKINKAPLRGPVHPILAQVSQCRENTTRKDGIHHCRADTLLPIKLKHAKDAGQRESKAQQAKEGCQDD